MIPKNAELKANADRAALAKMVAKAAPQLAKPPPRRGRGVPQKIEGRGNFLVRNPPKSVQVYPHRSGGAAEPGQARGNGGSGRSAADAGTRPKKNVDALKSKTLIKVNVCN